jgi:hypothetical protein
VARRRRDAPRRGAGPELRPAPRGPPRRLAPVHALLPVVLQPGRPAAQALRAVQGPGRPAGPPGLVRRPAAAPRTALRARQEARIAPGRPGPGAEPRRPQGRPGAQGATGEGSRARGGHVRRHDGLNPVEQRRFDPHPGSDAPPRHGRRGLSRRTPNLAQEPTQ